MGDDETIASGIEESIRRARRHEKILNAAEELFIEQGYERTSLAEIVRRSGGSLATLYEMFGNKQGLLHAITIRWVNETKDKRTARDNGLERTNRETLMKYVRSEYELWQSPRTVAFMRMLVSECMRDKNFAIQTYRDVHQPCIAELASLFAAWAATGGARIDEPEAVAHLFISTILGDMMLGKLFGIDGEILDDARVRWRLQPFFLHYEIF